MISLHFSKTGIILLFSFIAIAILGSIVVYTNLIQIHNLNKNIPVITPYQPPKPLEIKGSIPYWDQDKAYQSFQEHISLFNYVNFFWYYMEPDGSVKKYEYADEDPGEIEFAYANGVKVSAVITNLPEYTGATWDSGRVQDVISDPEVRKKHVEEISQKLNDFNFDGVIIDYEGVRPEAKNDFTDFIHELAVRLHEENKIVSVVLHPKTDSRDITGNGAFQDWKALSLWADQLQIMAYGEHWDNSESGPIASISWVKQIIAYAKFLNITKEKIFLGIPLYGYDWDKSDDSKAVGVTFNQVQDLLHTYAIDEQWDQRALAPYFEYQKGNHRHEVWFENARSVEQKVNLARSAGYAGVTLWRLGGEDPAIWQNLTKFK